MPATRGLKIIAILITGCAVLLAALFFSRLPVTKKEVPGGWREDFIPAGGAGKEAALPKGWRLVKKPGTRPALFSVKRDMQNGVSFLHMEADKASASLIARPDGVDLQKTPVMRWRWRTTVLPEGADGRVKAKDDQAIGLYLGTGSPLNNKSVSYRWDTETPKGAGRRCA